MSRAEIMIIFREEKKNALNWSISKNFNENFRIRV